MYLIYLVHWQYHLNTDSVESDILSGSVLIGFKTFVSVLFETFDSADSIEDSDGGVISDNIAFITDKESPSSVSVTIINHSKQAFIIIINIIAYSTCVKHQI